MDFNCTIQELKQNDIKGGKFKYGLFQLHHTGIKTRKRKGVKR